MNSTHSLVCDSGSDVAREVYGQLDQAFLGQEVGLSSLPIHRAYSHHFSNRGGGTRMKMALGCGSLLGLNLETSCALAASVECLHNASLVQDDLQDKSSIRRGRQTVASKFGVDVALGLTNRLVSAAFVCVANGATVSTMQKLFLQVHQAIAETVDGQTSEFLGDLEDLTVASQLEASGKKSGPLFALALELPLISAGHHESLAVAHRAGIHFGLGYQIIDDLKDQAADASTGNVRNLVLMMKGRALGRDQSAETRAAELAHTLLHDSAEMAGRLPQNSGAPLIALVEAHLPFLRAYCS
jgi:geranylgeranyl pyrophosphate synthase